MNVFSQRMVSFDVVLINIRRERTCHSTPKNMRIIGTLFTAGTRNVLIVS